MTLIRRGSWDANRIRVAICVALLLVVVAQFGVVLAGVPLYYQRVVTGQVPYVEPLSGSDQEQMSNELIASRAAQRGLSLPAYAIYFAALNLLVTLGFWSAGLLVLWKAGSDWFRWMVGVVLIGFPGGTLWPMNLVTQIGLPYLGATVVLWPAYPLFLYLFPNGQAVPRWSRWPMVGYLAVMFAALAASYLSGFPGLGLKVPAAVSVFGPLIIFTGFPFIVLCQVYRYLRVSGPAERKQIQWFIAGVAIYVAVIIANITVTRGVQLVADVGFMGDLSDVLALIVPAAITMSILRYHLWDIDVIIRRTLVYSILTGLLAITYFGSILVLESVFRAITGQGQNSLVIVLSTLAIAALFVPLRSRVQAVIDRRFYRSKYDAARILAGFSATARDEVDLDMLSAQLVDVVDDSMQPASVGLWLRKAKGR